MMGIPYPPYHTYQAVNWEMNIALGDRRDSDNPFSWDRLVVNFPGSEGYNCKHPWV